MVKEATLPKKVKSKTSNSSPTVIQKKKKIVSRKFHQLPVDILVEIFSFLPRNKLSSIEHQSRLCRLAVGSIRRKEWNTLRNKLDSTIKSLIESCENEGFNFQSDRLQMTRKLTFVRKMRQNFGILESLIPSYDKMEQSTWCMLAKALDDVIIEQHRVLDEEISLQYARDIFFYGIALFPFFKKFTENYFKDIEPALMRENYIEPYSVGIFRLLNSSWSSTSLIDIFTPNDTEISIISIFTNLICIDNILDKLNVIDFEDKQINNETKLIMLKKLVFDLIYINDDKNLKSNYQDIHNLDTKIQSSLNRDDYPNELFDKLSGLYQSFLHDSNSRNRLKYATKYYKSADFKEKNIKVIRSCDLRLSDFPISDVEIDLMFACKRSSLPDRIKIRDKNINLKDNNVYDNYSNNHYYCATDSTFEKNVNKFLEYSDWRRKLMKERKIINDNEDYMTLNLYFTYSIEKRISFQKEILCRIFGENSSFTSNVF